MARTSIVRSVLTVLGGIVAWWVIIGGILVVGLDLRVELAGGALRPIFSFGSTDDHYVALEHNRSQHYSRHLPAGPLPTPRPETDTSIAAGAPPPPTSPHLEHASVEVRSDAYWTDFRGPNRDGHYTQTSIRTDWPAAGLEPVWSQPIGGGYASFVVAQGVAFTIEQRREQEVVAAYDLATGRELWAHTWDADFREPMGGPGPRATPTWHAGRIYALGATGQLWCLEADTGDVIWERDILSDSQATNLTWAMSAAPLVVDDLVVVQPGGTTGWSVVAYNRNTGDVVWHALDDVQAYTSPMTATLAGVRQVLTVTANRAVGLDPRDGELLWEHPWVVGPPPSMAQPVLLGDDRVFLSGSGAGATVIELSRAHDRFTVETVWSNNRMKNKFSSSVLHEGYLYGLDGAILACIDAATGELQWKGGRYGYGQLLLADGHLVVITERGDLVLVRATPAGHEEVASSDAIEGKTWNVPALADGQLLVRNSRQMAAFDLRLQ